MRAQSIGEVMSRQPGWEWHADVHPEEFENCVDEFWAYRPGATPELPKGNPWLLGYCSRCRQMLTECVCGHKADTVEVHVFIDPGGLVADLRVMSVHLDDLEFFLPFALQMSLAERE